MRDPSRAAVLLDTAAKLIGGGHWTRGLAARGEDGWEVYVTSERAHKFCALGALERARYLSDLGREDARVAEEYLAITIRDNVPPEGGETSWASQTSWASRIIRFNDDQASRARDVQAMMRKAARKLMSIAAIGPV